MGILTISTGNMRMHMGQIELCERPKGKGGIIQIISIFWHIWVTLISNKIEKGNVHFLK